MTNLPNRNISPQQAHQWLSSDEAILIDVREPDEFRTEHIAYALSLPLANICELPRHLKMPQGRKIIFQCLRGKRGEQACALVPQSDVPCDVYNIEGGIDAWKEAGLPVITSGAAKPPIFRQVQIIAGALVLACTLIGFSGQAWGYVLAGLLGAALLFAGLTGWCGLALLLAKAPWNRT